MEHRTWDITVMAQLETAAKEVLDGLTAGAAGGRARVLALYGDLGAGKTAFTKVVAKQLGISESVTSPTFVVMKRYEPSIGSWRSLVHIDAYRLESVEELVVLGFWDWLLESNTLIIIEWADKVESLLPTDTYKLRFSLEGESRTLEALPL